MIKNIKWSKMVNMAEISKWSNGQYFKVDQTVKVALLYLFIQYYKPKIPLWPCVTKEGGGGGNVCIHFAGQLVGKPTDRLNECQS